MSTKTHTHTQPWNSETWDGQLCVLHYPPSPPNPTLTLKVFSNRLVVQKNPENPWEEDIEELFLPPHPNPHTELDSLPILSEAHNLQLCSKDWTLTLPLNEEFLASQAPTWIPKPVSIQKDHILSSVAAYSAPHKTFLRECLHALHIEKTGEGHLPVFEGPPQFHLAWLQTLEKVQAKPTPLGEKPTAFAPALQMLALTQTPHSVIFPQNWENTNSLIRSLQRGIIVSMALRAPQELAAAKEFLIQEKNEKPADNTWKSLANLAQKPHDRPL